MGFEISTFHIDDDSLEGQNLRAIIRREHVSPEEAIRRALRGPAVQKTPSQELIGLFSSDEDAALMDEAMALVEEGRRTHTTRDIGL